MGERHSSPEQDASHWGRPSGQGVLALGPLAALASKQASKQSAAIQQRMPSLWELQFSV